MLINDTEESNAQSKLWNKVSSQLNEGSPESESHKKIKVVSVTVPTTTDPYSTPNANSMSIHSVHKRAISNKRNLRDCGVQASSIIKQSKSSMRVPLKYSCYILGRDVSTEKVLFSLTNHNFFNEQPLRSDHRTKNPYTFNRENKIISYQNRIQSNIVKHVAAKRSALLSHFNLNKNSIFFPVGMLMNNSKLTYNDVVRKILTETVNKTSSFPLHKNRRAVSTCVKRNRNAHFSSNLVYAVDNASNQCEL